MNETLPSVTAVVPTRDRPDQLRAALASIAASRYEGLLETVVVFDRSVPDRRLVRTGARAVRVVANDRTPGLAGARNTGILAATTDLVAFCDDDDEWLPGKLTAQVELLEATPDADVATTGILVDARGRRTCRVLDTETIAFEDLLRSRVTEAHPSTFLVRREALLGRVGLVDETLPGSYAEDYDWLLRAARHADILVVPAPLVVVHWHGGSYFTERWRTIVAALDHLLAAHPELAAHRTGRARIEAQQAFAHAAMDEPRPAARAAVAALRRDLGQPRAWIALAAAAGLVRPDSVLRLAHLAGKGI